MMRASRIAILAAIVFLPLLNGCVRSGAMPENPLAQSVDDVITRLGATLPGSYSNFAQHRLDSDVPLLQMNITRRETPGQFLIRQIAVDGNVPERQFVWQFSRTPGAELQLSFAPLLNDAPGQSCQLILLPSPNGISGNTDHNQCRLPNRENQPIGLLKEFLLNPEQIDLGERLINLDSGEPLAADTRLEFRRQREYRGWAGKRHDNNTADSSDDWLLAQPFVLHNQGDSVELFDGAGRSLGYQVQLARIAYRSDQPEVLRLAVIDAATGKQVAYAWSGVDAPQIGINLEWLQVGMELVSQRN